MAVKSFVWSTVAELKVYLGIPSSNTDFDAVLEDLLNQAARKIENALGRIIKDSGSDITEIQDGDPEDEGQYMIQVKNFPINSFTSLAFNNGTPSTPNWVVESADNYERDDELGILYLARDYSPFNRPIPRGRQNVRILYQGGYADADIPDDLILALHMQAAKLYEKRKSQGMVAESVAGTSISWNKDKEEELQEILNGYKRYF